MLYDLVVIKMMTERKKRSTKSFSLQNCMITLIREIQVLDINVIQFINILKIDG